MTDFNGGFVAGTLVHTDKGLVPIQQIKIGDLVVSKPQNGKVESTFKQVKRIDFKENQPVIGMVISAIHQEKDEAKDEIIFTTVGQLFWIFDDYERKQGQWLDSQDSYSALISSLQSDLTVVNHLAKLLKTQFLDKVFFPTDKDGNGIYLEIADYEKSQLNINDERLYAALILSDFSQMHGNFDKYDKLIFEPFCTEVYQLELVDNDTYFVGELGILVHQ